MQSAIGLKIAKYDRVELQITISFGLQSVTKILKSELQSAMGLQSDTIHTSRSINDMIYFSLSFLFSLQLII